VARPTAEPWECQAQPGRGECLNAISNAQKKNTALMVIKTDACVHILGTIGCSACARSKREQIGTWCSRGKSNVQHQHEKGGDRWSCNCGCKWGDERDECMHRGKVGRTSRRREALLRRTRATATEASDRAGHPPPTRPQTLQRHGLQQSPAPPSTHSGLMMVQCVARDVHRYARCDCCCFCDHASHHAYEASQETLQLTLSCARVGRQRTALRCAMVCECIEN
jgi:hypothetical protein